MYGGQAVLFEEEEEKRFLCQLLVFRSFAEAGSTYSSTAMANMRIEILSTPCEEVFVRA